MLAMLKRSIPLPTVGTYDQAVEADEKASYYGVYEDDTLMTERYRNILWGIGFVVGAVVATVVFWFVF